MDVIVYNFMSGKPTNKIIKLNKSIFDLKINNHIVYLEIKRYLSSKRHGKHKTKERSDIKGSTRKLHKQKGTGNSRKGNITNPIFRGGSRVFGPKLRTYNKKLNKNSKLLSKKYILSDKIKNKKFFIVEDFVFLKPKTSNLVSILNKFSIFNEKILFILSNKDKNLYLSSRNLFKKKITTFNNLNSYDLINSSYLIILESSVYLINKLYNNIKIK